MKRDHRKVVSLGRCCASLLQAPLRSVAGALTGVTTKFAALVLPAVGLAALTGVNESSAQTRSLLETRRDHVVIQQWDLSCGAAALATILKYQYSESVTEREIALEIMQRKEYLANPSVVRARQGYSLLDLQRVVERRHYRGTGLGRLSLSDLVARAPMIVPVKLHGYNHFIVFRGIYRGQVVLADPAWGNRTMAIGAFERAWIEYPNIGRTGFSVGPRDGSIPPNLLAPSAKDLLLAYVDPDEEGDHEAGTNPQDGGSVLLAGPALDLPVVPGISQPLPFPYRQPEPIPDQSQPPEVAGSPQENIIAVMTVGDASGSSRPQIIAPLTGVVTGTPPLKPVPNSTTTVQIVASTLATNATTGGQQVVATAAQTDGTSSQAVVPAVAQVTQVARGAVTPVTAAVQGATTALAAPLQGAPSSVTAPTLAKGTASTVQQVVATAAQTVGASSQAVVPAVAQVTQVAGGAAIHVTAAVQGATTALAAPLQGAQSSVTAHIPTLVKGTASTVQQAVATTAQTVGASSQAVAPAISQAVAPAVTPVTQVTGGAATAGKQASSTTVTTAVDAAAAAAMGQESTTNKAPKTAAVTAPEPAKDTTSKGHEAAAQAVSTSSKDIAASPQNAAVTQVITARTVTTPGKETTSGQETSGTRATPAVKDSTGPATSKQSAGNAASTSVVTSKDLTAAPVSLLSAALPTTMMPIVPPPH